VILIHVWERVRSSNLLATWEGDSIHGGSNQDDNFAIKRVEDVSTCFHWRFTFRTHTPLSTISLHGPSYEFHDRICGSDYIKAGRGCIVNIHLSIHISRENIYSYIILLTGQNVSNKTITSHIVGVPWFAYFGIILQISSSLYPSWNKMYRISDLDRLPPSMQWMTHLDLGLSFTMSLLLLFMVSVNESWCSVSRWTVSRRQTLFSFTNW